MCPKPWDDQASFFGHSKRAQRTRQSAVRKPKKQGESARSSKLRKDLSLQIPGSVWWKNAGSEYGEAGLPDVMGIVRGKLIAIEVKLNTGWFSRLQIDWLKKAERAGAVSVGLLFKDGKVFIIPTSAMGHKGNRKRELWVEVDYPEGLANIEHWR